MTAGDLRIGDRSEEFLSAGLNRFISTEAWVADEQQWRYGLVELQYTLEITLPDHGWEAHSVDPDVRVHVTNLPSPPIDQLVGHRLDELGTVSGWAGHDGGPLGDVTLALRARIDPGVVEIEPHATFVDPSSTSTEVAFTGPVALSPVQMRVRDAADADGFFTIVHGEEALRRAVRTDGEWWHLGETFPEERRHGGANVDSEGEDVAVLVVHRHGVDQRRRDLHGRGGERPAEVVDSALDRVRVEIRPQAKVADDLSEDLGRPVRLEQPAGSHRREEIRDLDPVQDVGVEHDDVAGHVLNPTYWS